MSSREATEYKIALLAEAREELQKADSKASILLAASGIGFSAILTAVLGGAWSPDDLHSEWAQRVTWLAVGAAIAGIFAIGLAVKPRVGDGQIGKENLFYFGHVNGFWPKQWPIWDFSYREHLAKHEFEKALVIVDSVDHGQKRLDNQIWFLSRIAWFKYRMIGFGLNLFAGAIGLAVLAVVLEKV